MSSTDNRIVQMQFDNKQFMKGAADTTKSLADVNKAVTDAGSSKGLLDLNTQMGMVGVTASKMAIVTTTALATIANKATNVALGLARSLTFDPIKQGFQEYEALLSKQNTIMNATGLSARAVKGYLTDLNTYSDKTIYSFSNMTDSITKFVNAGISLPQSVKSIKGIANAAAFAGASTQDANRAMFAFSQSMSTGFLMLNDWQQIDNANMGTIQFKETLLDAAVAAGTLTKRGNEYVTASGKVTSATKGWREGLQEQWATTEVLNAALQTYSDKSTAVGKKAAQSATEVRTFTAFMDTLKESIGSGWAGIFTSLFGNLKQATAFWTSFSGAVGGAVQGFFNFFSVALKTWRQMGGFEKTLQGFKNILAPFAALLGAIGAAWDAAFPSSNKGAGKALYGLSAGFELLTRPLAWLAEGIPAITPALTVLFRVIAAGANAIGDAVSYVWDFVNGAKELADLDAPNAGGFLGFIQDIIVVLDAAIDKAGEFIKKAGGIGGLFSGISLPSLPDLPSLPGGSASSGASQAASAAETTASGMGRAMEILRGIAVKMGAAFSWMWDQALGFFQEANPEDFVRAFNSAIFATMGIEIIRLVHNIGGAFKSFAEIGDGVGDVLSGAGAGLKSFQTAAQAKLILNIAIAIGVLAASLWVLSKIPKDELASALVAMGALFTMLNVTMKGFGKTLKATDGMIKSVNMVGLAASMLLLAVAMMAFATAMLIMNKVEWTSIAKGLLTMTVALKLVESLGNLAAGSYKNMLAGAAAIGAVSASMILLAGALLLFKLVDWKSMEKAGASIATVTGAIAGLALLPAAALGKVGLAMLGASAGMLLMANALIIFGLVEWSAIGKLALVLGALALALLAITAFGGPVAVGGMLALAASMVALALACMIFNNVEWASIAKATVVLTVLLAALAVGAAIMTAFLYAIAPVSPVLIILAAGFALLGVGMLAFAAAMTIAMGLAAAGTAAFAALATGAAVAIGVFLQTLALQAPIIRKSVLTILQEFINTIVQSIPMIIQAFKDIWKAIMKEMSSEDKKLSFGEIAEKYLDKFIKFARNNIPKVQRLFVDMVLSLLRALNSRADEFAEVGTQFIVSLIRGVGSRQQAIVNAAIDVVVKMAEGFRKNIKKLTDAGIDLIAGFLHDLASSIRSGSGEIGSGITDVIDAFRDVGVDMIQGLIEGASSVDIGGFISNLAEQLPGWARKVLDIHSPSRVFMEIGKFVALGLTKGIQMHAASAITAVASMLRGTIAMSDALVSKYIQKLDQQAIAAQAKAQGLADAARKAQKSADKTKTKEDDKAAAQLSRQARKAAREARKEQKQAQQARHRREAAQRWEKADAAERAEIRSNQAQNQLGAAKDAERSAEAARIQAKALEEQAKKAGSEKERRRLLAEAEKLREQAREDAKRANQLIREARESAASALVWQKKAGKEAAESFQEQFEQQAADAAEQERYEKLSDTEKADYLQKQADALRAKSEKDLARAKELAFTDIDRANEVAQRAMDEAERARDLLRQAEDLRQNAVDQQTRVLNLSQTDAAARSVELYSGLYDSAYAAAAAAPTFMFEQNNYSPESLSDAEIYRKTQNQLASAALKVGAVA